VEFWINYPQMLPITKKMVRFLFSPRTLPLELQLIFFTPLLQLQKSLNMDLGMELNINLDMKF